MRVRRQLLLLVPILLVGAVLAAIALLPRERVDAALWWITGLSGLSMLAYLLLARALGRGTRATQDRERHRPRLTPAPSASPMPGSPAETPSSFSQAVIEPVGRLVRVHLAGHTLAETRLALILREDGQEAKIYIPRADIDMTMLQPSIHRIHDSGRGSCAFFNLPDAGDRSENAAWSYENPPTALMRIKDHVAFDPKCVDWIQIER